MDLNKTTFSFDDVLKITEILRGEGGCPWDREQTHKSLAKFSIEEAYELQNAVENDDVENLMEELGDLLLHIALHVTIAKEKGEFSASDIYTKLCKKLISRHTHVFGDVVAENSVDALSNWEKQKISEHKLDNLSQYILDIPKGMPALLKAQKTQSRASKGGYVHSSVQNAMADLKSEIDELAVEIEKGDSERITNEGGDVLFATVNVLRMLNVDSETALLTSNKKFTNRVLKCEKMLLSQGKKLTDLNQTQFDQLWKKAKADL